MLKSLTSTALALATLALSAAEITDPAAYSAGKMSAAEIDGWFKDNIKPEDFDLWHGKKDRHYLNGSWKFIRLETPMEVKALSPGSGSYEINVPANDHGERQGFPEPGFDDSKWFNQPVPWAWIYRFPSDGKGEQYVRDGNPYVHGKRVALGWYRRSFAVPDAWNGKRVLLNFRAATYKATVYVNGVKVGEHEDSRKPIHWIAANRSEEAFSFDITALVKFGQANTLAVKVDAPCANGGIWQEVYLEAVPQIYVERALATPDPVNKRLRLKAFVVNTTTKNAELAPSATLGPWKSSRYTLADGKPETFPLPKTTLKPGLNELDYELPMPNPNYWSPERPYLYHLTLKDQAGTTIGQERFGFRTFTVGKQRFALNGKPVFLRSEDCFPGTWNFPGNGPLILGLGILNRGEMMDQTIASYLRSGFNLMRCQAVYPPHIYFDLADERGLMLYDEEGYWRDHRGATKTPDGRAALTDKFKRAIRDRCQSAYNHPSLVIRSCGNEQFDPQTYDEPIWKDTGWAPLLGAIHDEYKFHDQTRPVTSSSGRAPVDFPDYPKTSRKAKSDFDDCHPYVTNRVLKHAEFDDCPLAYKTFKDAYTRDNGGAERAMLDGESSEFYTFVPGTCTPALRNRVADFTPHMKDGEFDRLWLAENLKSLDQKYLSEACEFSLIPLNLSVDTDASLKIQAWHNRQVMELERRKRDYLAGYVLHCPAIFPNFTAGTPFPHTFEAAAKAQQPVLACFGGFFNRHPLAGQTENAELFLINDSEGVLENADVALSLDGKVPLATFRFEYLAVGEMKSLPVDLKLPAGTPTGHHNLVLDVTANGKSLSSNDYDCYVLSPADIRLTAKGSATLYAAGDFQPLAELLTKLGASFKIIKDLKTLTPADTVLLLPPGSYKEGDAALLDWVKQGGKLASFEQDALPPLFPGRAGAVGKFGWWTEIVMRQHPLFTGLEQDDFRFWAGAPADRDGMKLLDTCFVPLNEGVLAMLNTLNYRQGMAAGEIRVEKGRYLFSQLGAVKRFGRDAVATKYTLNFLNYILGGFDDPAAPVLKPPAKAAAYQVDQAKTFSVDLRRHANMAFADEIAHDGKGGWSDQGPDNDARALPLGCRTFAGVPFVIVDAAKNGGKSCVALRGHPKQTGTGFLPAAAKGIKVGRKAKKLYFFLAASWMPGSGPAVATLRINMNIGKGGGTVASSVLELIPGKNLADWWGPRELPDALLGWSGEIGTGANRKEIGAYVVEWLNPEPSVEVESVDFISAERAVPILIAVTGEAAE